MKTQLCAFLVFASLLCCCGETIKNNLAHQTRKNGFEKSQYAVLKLNPDYDMEFKIPTWVCMFNNMFYQLCQKFVNKKIKKLSFRRRRSVSITSPALLTPTQSTSNIKLTSAVQKIENNNSSLIKNITVSNIYRYLPTLSTITTQPVQNHLNLASTNNILKTSVAFKNDTTILTTLFPIKINQTDRNLNCTVQNNYNYVINKMADENSSTWPEKTGSIIIYFVLAIIIMIIVVGLTCFIYKRLFTSSHRKRYQIREMVRIYDDKGEATETKV